ncbi:Ig-like domain-containing protein [Pseudomonas sp. D2-30]|uniref:Ig-like domain-containing protein n=1 Tax=unclassified Pseudomonas TaxID=196821 RepID=UPI003DA8E1FD
MSGTPERAVNLPPPSVDEAPDGVLDPADIPPDGARVRLKRSAADTGWQKAFVFVGPTYSNQLPVGTTIKDVVFYVEAEHFVADADGIVIIRYDVLMSDGSTEHSENLELKVDVGFEAPAIFDLSQDNYVAVADKAPLDVPPYARMTRLATGGTPPYRYESSNEYVASVDAQTGEVTARGNGQCTITATDSLNQPRQYELTVKGIRQVQWLSNSADWQGMTAVCDVAGVDIVARSDLDRLRAVYKHPDIGEAVGEYLGWLPYPFWTGDAAGAGTYWIYDMDTGDKTSADAGAHHQALGISKRVS